MPDFTRRAFAFTPAIAALSSALSTASASTPVASPVTAASAIGNCGIKYDLGAELFRGELSRTAEHEPFFRDELTAIRDQLHCDRIDLYGSDVDLLLAGLDIAADLGFDIHLQTRLNFLPEADMLDRLAVVATQAEHLRQEGIPIVLDVGCEYLLFADGLIEGQDVFEQMEVITSGRVDWADVIRRLSLLLASLANTARESFGGLLTYSDTPDMTFAWEPFDIVCIDHYLSSESRSTYVQTIDELAASGKPVWISEFGSTPWRGASGAGGMGWDIIDYSLDPPEIVDGIVRDEEEQARVIFETLDHIARSRAERAYLYEFITTGSPRNEDPRFDYDLTGYGIVSTWGPEHDRPYDTTGYWEPKVAFDQLAAWNLARLDGVG